MGDDPSFEDFSEVVFPTPDVELPKRETKKEENPFEILSLDNIIQHVFEKVLDVQSFLNLPTTISARVLLSHYKWDSQRLIAEYYESDQDTFFEQAHVANPFKTEQAMLSDNSDECKICFTDVISGVSVNLYGLACGHQFCTTCWKQHLTVKIAEEGLNETILCPQPNCATLVGDEDILQLIDDPNVIARYQKSMSNSFVQTNNSIRWCPTADCPYAMKKKRTVERPCVCKCGYEFCFECNEYWHEPVTCTRLKQWKNNRDAETYSWIAEHAKVCPKCEAVIEKNGGCNHMTCRNCRHEFCWVCMGDWGQHHACNRFDESKPVVGLVEIARFNHFRDRYVIQLESLRLDANLYTNLESKIDEMKDNFSMTTNQVRFLRDAVKVLHISRRTLTYTFVFAYFLKKNNQVEIFEDNQSDLESAVERLSGYLEQEMTVTNVVDLKRNIQDSYKYCERRCNVLIEHIREAEEKQLWHMNS